MKEEEWPHKGNIAIEKCSIDKWMKLGPWKFYNAENEYILHHGRQKREAFTFM